MRVLLCSAEMDAVKNPPPREKFSLHLYISAKHMETLRKIAPSLRQKPDLSGAIAEIVINYLAGLEDGDTYEALQGDLPEVREGSDTIHEE